MKITRKKLVRHLLPASWFTLAMVGFCLLMSANVHGQQAGASKALVRIREIPRQLGRRVFVASPNYQHDVRRSGRVTKRRDWASFDVNYETAPEWLDELTFNFYVMTQDVERQYNFFEATVTYTDVGRGQHIACVMLPPAAVERYGEPTAFGVEVLVGGEKVAARSVGPADEWWTMIADKPNIIRRPGYLVDRSKTPFALAFIDDYEVVR